jgi:glutamate dehydrogenase
MENTLRTNFYHADFSIALKLHSEKIDILPNPRPMFEIFLSAPEVEGIHLRGSRVARGGIRWSDRYEDYRSEVLGLMKTQKIKNALIVPGGAKGGFVVKNLPSDPAQIAPAVENAYKIFVRSLLSVTDNRTATGIKHPEGLVIHDGEDPYLVVAADKGTATFSDIANRVATEEFNFWLGDAFASGGSQGYDHKIYGITAKGAWECVKRHFHDMGFDSINNSFTAVGIGDMAGDVFGNGLLLSRSVKLLAAFNHKHVFLDPNPDPEPSYQERRRLFVTKGTQWSDYKKELISAGGGVFGRFDKEITLSPQIRKALDIPESVPAAVNGEQLINLILKASVDMLWNGGIGTYVKSEAESHADVNDGTNDRVRVNATELRAKVVAEGGNLGFTQLARIEFAQRGGRINTDAIDNSGGVDLSDHEVNLKILFTGLMRDKKITLPDRNQLLKEMAPDVVEAVLDHNRSPALVLSLGVLRSKRTIEYFQSLIRELHRMGYINRALECLPDDEELRERIAQKAAMSRPELAVCTAAVKMWVKDSLLSSNLPSDPLLKDYLFDYFPPALRTRFKNELSGHPLSANIIATQVANTLVDTMGITFVHRMCVTYSVPPTSVLKCALAAEHILATKNIRNSIRKLDTFDNSASYLALSIEVSRALMDGASWLLSSHDPTLTLAKLVQLYETGYRSVVQDIEHILVGKEYDAYRARILKYQQFGLDDFAAKSLAIFPRIVIVLEMLWAARQSGEDMKRVAALFSTVMEELGVGSFLSQTSAPETANKWENELLLGANDEIRRSLSRITTKLLEAKAVSRDDALAHLRKLPGFERVKATLEEARAETPSVAAMSVVAKQLRSLLPA